ncbi:transcriptional regulator [Lentilactobacillus curieae]|uniref:Transcriptional regulator n=1 Tax=Lentilactobacillus curieae TaxID=1138822 RepID=A0A1S6QHX0_9LACO|nr:helix-turn-helix transcriptional regulator [Lentilactobacillus curieae]AQW21202.1 transcriptional regulator [Lentilactobacillus curieae]
MNVSEKIKMCRKQKNMTQLDLSKQLHVSRKTISGWETDRNSPDMNSLIKMSELFGISMDDLLIDTKGLPAVLEQEKQLKQKQRFFNISYCLCIILLIFSYIHMFGINNFHLSIVPILLTICLVVLISYYPYWNDLKPRKIASATGFFFLILFINGLTIGLNSNFQRNLPSDFAGILGSFTGEFLLIFTISVSLSVLIFLRPKLKNNIHN